MDSACSGCSQNVDPFLQHNVCIIYTHTVFVSLVFAKLLKVGLVLRGKPSWVFAPT